MWIRGCYSCGLCYRLIGSIKRKHTRIGPLVVGKTHEREIQQTRKNEAKRDRSRSSDRYRLRYRLRSAGLDMDN